MKKWRKRPSSKIEDVLQKGDFFFNVTGFWRYQLRLVICFFQVLLAHEGRKGEPRDRVVLLAKFLGSSSAVWTNTLEVTRKILVSVDGMYKFEIHYFSHAGGCVLGVEKNTWDVGTEFQCQRTCSKVWKSKIAMESLPSLKLTARTWKWMVGIPVSFWDGLFSGAMLVAGSVLFAEVSCLISIGFQINQALVQITSWQLPSQPGGLCSHVVCPKCEGLRSDAGTEVWMWSFIFWGTACGQFKSSYVRFQQEKIRSWIIMDNQMVQMCTYIYAYICIYTHTWMMVFFEPLNLSFSFCTCLSPTNLFVALFTPINYDNLW